MGDINTFLSDCISNLNLDLKEYASRFRALYIDCDYEFITLDLLDSFGYLLLNLKSGVISLILDSKVLQETNMDIIIPEEIKLVHIINYNKNNLYNFHILYKNSTIILYHQDDINIKSLNTYVKYLKYSDIISNKYLKVSILDTLFIDDVSIIGKERKLLKSIDGKIGKINNLVLLIDEYNLNELSYDCDYDAMQEFIEHHVKDYIKKINKLMEHFNINFIHLKILLHQNNKYMKYILENVVIKNGKSLLTSGFNYDIMSMFDKYGIIFDEDVKEFILKFNLIESKLNYISSNVYVEFVL